MSEKTDNQGAPITIKKYANRRLYNTATSSYVTLGHLATMVKEGIDFVVYDAKSGADITRSVLTQIIMEEESKGGSLLPIAFLRRLISFYGDSLGDFVPRYLELSMENFARNQDQMRGQIGDGIGGMFPFRQMEEMGRANMKAFQNAMDMFSPLSPGAPGVQGNGAPGNGPQSNGPASEPTPDHGANQAPGNRRSVLTQIIMEEESKGGSLLPIAFLRRLISFYGDSLGDFVPRYLELSMENFARNQDQMRGQIGDGIGGMFPFRQMEEMGRANMKAFQNAMDMFSPLSPGAPGVQGNGAPGNGPQSNGPASEPTPDHGANQAPGNDGELDALKAQLDAMQRQLNKIANQAVFCVTLRSRCSFKTPNRRLFYGHHW